MAHRLSALKPLRSSPSRTMKPPSQNDVIETLISLSYRRCMMLIGCVPLYRRVVHFDEELRAANFTAIIPKAIFDPLLWVLDEPHSLGGAQQFACADICFGKKSVAISRALKAEMP